MGYPADKPVLKKVRQKIYNCAGAYMASLSDPEEFASSSKASGDAPYGAVKHKERYRRRGKQGRPLKGALFQYELKQEFIDFRKTVSARIWPKQVLKMGISLQVRIAAIYKRHGQTPPEMPRLDLGKKGRKWLRKWRRRNQISFKKCQRKFKVSKEKILRRTKTTWMNSWSGMMVFRLLFGEARMKKSLPPWPYIDVRDQMGRMLNEAESKNAPTLAFAGDDGQTGGLKTNHGQSRQRASMWTMLSNDPSEVKGLEICFKIKTDRCLKDLIIPQGMPITLNNSKSGSYNLEATLLYLDRWYLKWTPERAENFDYRITHLDDYAVHNMEVVRKFLWDRGYLKNKIGGGTTYCMCGCDTDMHSDLQSDCMQMDMDWAAAEQQRRPWAVPFKSRQVFLNDFACIWDRFPHAKRGIDTFRTSGIGARPPERIVKGDGSWEVPLVGPDDWRVGGNDAKQLWEDNQMPKRRKVMLEQIYKDYDAGKITEWNDVQNYQHEHSDAPFPLFSRFR